MPDVPPIAVNSILNSPRESAMPSALNSSAAVGVLLPFVITLILSSAYLPLVDVCTALKILLSVAPAALEAVAKASTNPTKSLH